VNLLILSLILVFLMGCTYIPTGKRFLKQYEVDAHTLIIADWYTIKMEYQRLTNENKKDFGSNDFIVLSPWGFCDPFKRIMWVTGDSVDKPDFKTYGHEIWHLPELGGPFFHNDSMFLH